MSEMLAHAVGPRLPAIRDITLGDLLREAAETVPDRIALICGTKNPGLGCLCKSLNLGSGSPSLRPIHQNG